MIKSLLTPWRDPLRIHDLTLLAMMFVLAACGLIYEYLLSHYAARIIGATESTIYAMIGVMIVSMGIGAFYAKYIKCPFTGLAWLEVSVGLLGGLAVLVMAVIFSAAYVLPQELHQLYGIDPSIAIEGGMVAAFRNLADAMPFVIGFVLGVMIGMEIPLVARIRQTLHDKHLQHNIGTIYGADYIGAGCGAALWVLVCLHLPIMMAAVLTASFNILVGVLFLWRYGQYVRTLRSLWLAHVFVASLLLLLAVCGGGWLSGMNSMLYQDKVEYQHQTPYQNLTLTSRQTGPNLPKVSSLYINGRLQFSSSDEVIYHSFLTYPALLASARQERVLVIGGGDGLALRDILRWQPNSVTLIDLDKGMIDLFTGNAEGVPDDVNKLLLGLNRRAFLDSRVSVIVGDAFLEVEELIRAGKIFDTIVVDLPDPNHPDLSRLYSDYFYAKLGELLAGDGAIAIQSTSPYHAKKAFMSIGKTLVAAGFTTEQYHANVPTFGEWGWTIGVKQGLPASSRIAAFEALPVDNSWLSVQQILAAFVFAPSYYNGLDNIDINELGSRAVYRYHHLGWRNDGGIFFANNIDLKN
jgi:spermidine synthase